MKTATTIWNLTLNERYFDELLMQNGKVRRLQHADGFINLSQNGTPVEYFYYLKDHLGNVRATLTNSSLNGLTVMQANDYYPFGMSYTPRQTGMQDSNWENKYKYNGKEEQEMPGKWLDYGARYYDPALGRFHTIDPHAENYLSWTPYNYVANNPIALIDPDGMDWYTSTDGSATMWKKGSGDIDGYTNNGANHTQTLEDGTTINYEQNEAVEMTEKILAEGDWETQRAAPGEASDKKGNKVGDEGNCFKKSGDMVAKSGTESLGGVANNTNSDKKLSYLDSQVDQGKSARVHVDYNSDNIGDHWVAISSRTTNLKTQTTTSFGFYDPGTIRPNAGTHSSNTLKINSNGSMSGTTNYNKNTYNVVNVRKNK